MLPSALFGAFGRVFDNMHFHASALIPLIPLPASDDEGVQTESEDEENRSQRDLTGNRARGPLRRAQVLAELRRRHLPERFVLGKSGALAREVRLQEEGVRVSRRGNDQGESREDEGRSGGAEDHKRDFGVLVNIIAFPRVYGNRTILQMFYRGWKLDGIFRLLQSRFSRFG